MRHAGIDYGSTLIKAFWHDGTTHRIRSVEGSAIGRADLLRSLTDDGVSHLRVTGIGAPDFSAPGFSLLPADIGVDDEIARQAHGTRWLLNTASTPLNKMLVAAVGTGVSYTSVSGNKAKRSPLGSCHGGGTMMGLARLIGVNDFATLEALAAKGNAPDLLIKDKLPNAPAHLGDLIIAHFAKPGASREDLCAGIFSFTATSVFKDLAVLRSVPFSKKDVVLIGSVARSPVFQRHLLKLAPRFPKKTSLHFPVNGEYAAAVGAWLAGNARA